MDEMLISVWVAVAGARATPKPTNDAVIVPAMPELVGPDRSMPCWPPEAVKRKETCSGTPETCAHGPVPAARLHCMSAPAATVSPCVGSLQENGAVAAVKEQVRVPFVPLMLSVMLP